MPAAVDLRGQRFGRLEAVSRALDTAPGRLRWLCRCDCGGEVVVVSSSLRSGLTKSCGCAKRDRLRAINAARRLPPEEKRRRMIERQMRSRKVSSDALPRPRIKPTPEQKREQQREYSRRYWAKHPGRRAEVQRRWVAKNPERMLAYKLNENNLHRQAEYRIWKGMRNRCQNPNNKSYANWGGRGITVCARWDESFEAFLEDMGRRPSPNHSIDRIDVNGNYEPGNCRWATAKQQAENRRLSNGRAVTILDRLMTECGDLLVRTWLARAKRELLGD